MLPIFLFFTKLGAVNFTSGMLLKMANLLIYNYEFRNEERKSAEAKAAPDTRVH